MDDGDVVQSIIEGTTQHEREIDVLHLCLTAATLTLTRSRDRLLGMGPPPALVYYRRLRLVGEILCPIFTPVKPPDYVEGMARARLSYRGIATDPDLQRDYAGTVMALVSDGYLDSLAAAIEARLWERLQSSSGMPA